MSNRDACGCSVTGMVRSNYATSNEENLGTLVTTFPGASVSALSFDSLLCCHKSLCFEYTTGATIQCQGTAVRLLLV